MIIGPQIPRAARTDTRERYCRAILTLFRPWRNINHLCQVNQTWNDAFQDHETDFSDSSKRIIQNIEFLHECKSDRDENLLQIVEGEEIDTADSSQQNHLNLVDDSGSMREDFDDLLELMDFQGEYSDDASSDVRSTSNEEHLYIQNAITCVVHTERFIPSSRVDCKQISRSEKHCTDKKTSSWSATDPFFSPATNVDIILNSRWQNSIKHAKYTARERILNGLEDGSLGDDDTSTNVEDVTLMSSEMQVMDTGANNEKEHIRDVVRKAQSLYSSMDISQEFMLNDEQNRAYTIITDHLDGKSHLREGISFETSKCINQH